MVKWKGGLVDSRVFQGRSNLSNGIFGILSKLKIAHFGFFKLPGRVLFKQVDEKI